jgi:hypothetical protein
MTFMELKPDQLYHGCYSRELPFETGRGGNKVGMDVWVRICSGKNHNGKIFKIKRK